jgi:hypothetical protein
MLEGIAAGWGLTVRSEEVESEEAKAAVAETLAAHMLDEARLASVLASLEEPAQEALAEVAAQGVVRVRRWSRRHGEIERLGPARLARSQPWQQPETPAERLWYLGLLYRDYGVIGAYRGEVYFLPPDLLSLLPPLSVTETTAELTPVMPPEGTTDRGLALCRDVLMILGYARSTALRSRAPHILRKRDIAILGDRLSLTDHGYIILLQHLVLQARLLQRHRGSWQPRSITKRWLQAKPYARAQKLFQTWREDATWNELAHIPSLDFQRAGEAYNPQRPRAKVLAQLQACQVGTWYALTDLVNTIKALEPDYMRPDGDYDTWYVRDAQSRQYLSGFGHWERIEGAFIKYLIRGPLYWLGAVALDGDPAPMGFTVTPLGAALLGWDGAEAPQIAESLLDVQPNMTVNAAYKSNYYDHYQLMRFAEWQSMRPQAMIYRITERSLAESLEEGIEVKQILAFLRRASGEKLPREVAQTLEGWASRYGRVKLSRLTVLITRDAETMQELRAHQGVRPYLGYALTPRVALVDENEMPTLVRLLKRLNYWPRIEELD